MKKGAIGFIVGFATAIASAIIGLRSYANDPLISEQIAAAIPSPTAIIGLILKGSAFIWLGAFLLGLLIVVINWAIAERARRKRGKLG